MSIRKFAIFCVNAFAKLFYHHKVYGKEHLPVGAAIISSNHSSFLDPPLIGISYPGEVQFLARDTLFRLPLFAWLIRKLNTHPVARGKGNVAAIRKCLDFLNEGKKVVIFPEGKRSKDGSLQKGQNGVAMLVLRTNCLVIPAYVHGTFDIWNSRRKLPRLKGQTACVFGTPLDFSKLDTSNKKEAEEKITESIMFSIATLHDWYVAGAKGTPP